MEDVNVEVWAMFQKINYKDYDGKPVFTVQDIVGSYLLDVK